jgi:hypothetical protein
MTVENERGRAVSFLGIHKSNLLCSVPHNERGKDIAIVAVLGEKGGRGLKPRQESRVVFSYCYSIDCTFRKGFQGHFHALHRIRAGYVHAGHLNS